MGKISKLGLDYVQQIYLDIWNNINNSSVHVHKIFLYPETFSTNIVIVDS